MSELEEKIYVLVDNGLNFCFTTDEYKKIIENNGISPYTNNKLTKDMFIPIKDNQSCIKGLNLLQKSRKKLLENTLQIWGEYGDSPHKLFETDADYLENYNMINFRQDLEKKINKYPLFRYTRRLNNPKVGNKITYDRPTSWTFNEKVVKNMTQGMKPEEFKYMVLEDNAKGIFNNTNMYGEDEVILRPITLEIISIKNLPFIKVKNITYKDENYYKQ